MLVDVSKRLLSATRRENTSLFRYGAVLSQAARRLAAFISSLVLRTVEFLFYHQCSPGAEIRGIWLSAFRPRSGNCKSRRSTQNGARSPFRRASPVGLDSDPHRNGSIITSPPQPKTVVSFNNCLTITPEPTQLSMETPIRRNSKPRSTGSWLSTSRRLEDRSRWADHKVPKRCSANFWNGERATTSAASLDQGGGRRTSASKSERCLGAGSEDSRASTAPVVASRGGIAPSTNLKDAIAGLEGA